MRMCILEVDILAPATEGALGLPHGFSSSRHEVARLIARNVLHSTPNIARAPFRFPQRIMRTASLSFNVSPVLLAQDVTRVEL